MSGFTWADFPLGLGRAMAFNIFLHEKVYYEFLHTYWLRLKIRRLLLLLIQELKLLKNRLYNQMISIVQKEKGQPKPPFFYVDIWED